MLLYNLRLAAKSIRRHPVLSALIIGGIALGVGVATSFITVYHVLSGDPIPAKSDRLYYVRLDSWDPAKQAPHPGGIPTQITYQDMRRITESHIPERQTASFKSRMVVYPPEGQGRPFQELARLTFADFFEMFQVPFRYGSPWDRAADAAPEPVVVLGAELNDRLFGGADSVGETVHIAGRDFQVVGVLEPWNPTFKFYDMTQNPYQEPEEIFMPLNFIEPMELTSAGNRDGWARTEGDTFRERLWASETVFLQMWVELADAEQLAAYRDFLAAYALEQKKLGRFQRPLDTRATPLMELVAQWGAVPEESRAMAMISVLFLVVCALNLIGLFLGKFLARSSVVGVRRALGASRRAIFLQHVVECELIGLVGGTVGLLLALGGLAVLNRAFGTMLSREGFFHLDATMIAAAVFLSLVAGLIAGLYPAWRICRVAPADHLKAQ